jgi:hypothetical protein
VILWAGSLTRRPASKVVLVPTALDNGQRGTKALLASIVRRGLDTLHGGDQAHALMSDEKPPACLGCGSPVYESQRFLSLLRSRGHYRPVLTQRMLQPRPELEPRAHAFTFIGVFHEACDKKLSKRLKAGKVTLPETPSFVSPTDLLAAVRPPSRAPTRDGT